MLALRIALANLLNAYEELSLMFVKNPELNLFYRQAKVLMKEYHWKSIK